MFNIGAGELIFILVVALLVLGPQRLPEFARTIGRFVREFRRQTDEVRSVVEREFYRMDQEILEEPKPQLPAAPIPAMKSVPVKPASLGSGGEASGSGAQPGEGASSLEGSAVRAEPSTAQPPASGATDEAQALPRAEHVPGTVARQASTQDESQG
jgi:sec-independent protein translocase protein TatB